MSNIVKTYTDEKREIYNVFFKVVSLLASSIFFMIEGIPRISVLVITYNQEELIKRALDSLIVQRDYIYEICVSDDCSTDRTWEVLQDYDRRYPCLFKLNRNNKNLGIFENIEKSWSMPSGDIVYNLAGDDECGEGWFKRVIDFIKEKNIAYKKEFFCIYGDYELIYPQGNRYLFKNSKIMTEISPISLSLRFLICNRSTCYSIRILRKFQNVSQGRSFIAETAQDRQLQLFTEKNYYIPHIGNRYFAQIGISTNLINSDRNRERAQRYWYVESFLLKNGIQLSKKDHAYCEYISRLTALPFNHSLQKKVLCANARLNSFDSTMESFWSCIKQILIALR